MTPKAKQRPTQPLVGMAAQACLTAKDAAYNLQEFLTNSSGLALATVRQCERELDAMERQIDEQWPQAMVRVDEQTARELLAAVRFITDLERIGDLVLWVAERAFKKDFANEDKTTLKKMLAILEDMLLQAHDGLLKRDPEVALGVLRQDRKLDRLRREAFQRHLALGGRRGSTQSVDALLAVQSIERAGDHATNLAEELVYLIEHRSIRHTKIKPTED